MTSMCCELAATVEKDRDGGCGNNVPIRTMPAAVPIALRPNRLLRLSCTMLPNGRLLGSREHGRRQTPDHQPEHRASNDRPRAAIAGALRSPAAEIARHQAICLPLAACKHPCDRLIDDPADAQKQNGKMPSHRIAEGLHE
ncbi:hypothetical protein [Bradyrhizobium sp. JR3.5]